jgi:hypothetical protein
MESEEKMTVEYVNPKTLKIFDYSRKLFPELKGEAYEFLKADIKENGIRTPLEITLDNLILCGHERHRVALELELKLVPIIRNFNPEVTDQKIRCIKDNLARKAVDTRTKVSCFGELLDLYGLKRGQTKTIYVDYVDEPIGRTTENFMTHDDIAEEVGLSGHTLERALKIEKSNLPEQIKDATFKGKLGISPTAELLKESEAVQKEVIPKILHELAQDKEHVYVQDIVDDVKGNKDQPTQTMHDFLQKYKNALEKVDCPDSSKSDTELMLNFFKKMLQDKNISCRTCGEKTLQWKCGHEF